MLRCRAAALLAGRASANVRLLSCDPSPAGQQREGGLALLQVLGRGPLDGARATRFLELARSSDRVVREAALELLSSHEEVPQIPELLARALSAPEAGVRATAAKVLARYPSRAEMASAAGEEAQSATKPAHPKVVQALTRAIGEAGQTQNIELQSALLDAAASLELLGAKPALERACASTNPTLRKHAELGLAALGDRGHRCPNVVATETWTGAPPAALELEFDTDAGPLTITLQGDRSPFAVARFVELARAGFYDGLQVHRVVPGFVAQFGDPDGDGFGAPESPPLRCQLGFDRFEAGSVGVALAGRDTGSSQFFVTLRESPHLTGEYSLVGQAGPGWDRLVSGDRILKVRVREAPEGATRN
jgi:cyclophilin family peptidyl-prolyl cis-trans isomerase